MKQERKSHVGQSRLTAVLYAIAAVIALAGLADATFLTVMFLSGETSVCSGSAGCFEVLGSKYARLGPVPVAAFGMIAYFSAFSFATFAAFGSARARKFFIVTVWTMFAVTLWFLFVQAILLHAFCRFCLLSAALVFLLAGIVVIKPSSD